MRRRELLVLGSILGVAVAIPPVLRRWPASFEFQPLHGFPGFRRLAGGPVSGGADPFFGLDGAVGAPATSRGGSPCQDLFGSAGWSPDTVPVAVFSDFNCPYCKVLEQRLIDLRDAGTPIRLIWHEMPLLGPSSMRYAQAATAAAFLGAGEAARTYLTTHALRPGPAALRRLAEATGLSADALIEQVASRRVADTIATSTAWGRQLGIPGTPGTLVGRTLVVGAISRTDLVQLIRLEASEPQTVCP